MMLKGLLVAFILLIAAPAWALGLTATAGCVARYPAAINSGGVAVTPADGVVSYKLYVSPIAPTGGPVAPPPGSTIILAAGTAVPICPNLVAGQQYAYWVAPILTPNAPPPGQLPGTPSEGAPSASFPFVMGTAAPATKVLDVILNPTMTP